MFRDRQDAGRQLAVVISKLELVDPLVLGIPRGGVVMAAVIADALKAELDVVLAHKLRSPHQPELAFGAVDENGRVYLNHHLSEAADVTAAYLASERQIQLDEIKRRRQLFRLGKPAASMAGRSVILTDDGIATGSTVFAAIEVIKAERPHELIVAVPVAPARKLGQLRQKCDHVVVLVEPQDFMAVSQFYQSFLPVSDQQVVDLLNRHRASEP